jgi:DNA repair exonuclease SbcCD ATPase subunit
MTFTVASNVNEVVIYVAKYKDNATKVKINGTEYTISGASNSGAYDAIVIDTSTNKTVKFETLSGGKRAMINTIVFKATE